MCSTGTATAPIHGESPISSAYRPAEVHRTSLSSVTTMSTTAHAGKVVTQTKDSSCGPRQEEHVISRVMTGLVAQKRAESATCSRRHAVNLVPLDEFALGEHCFHAVAHICLCHGAHRQAQELGAGGAPSRAAGGRKRPSRHGVSKSERRGTMRHARMSSVSCGSGHTLRRQVRSGRQHLWHCAFLSKSGNKGQIC